MRAAMALPVLLAPSIVLAADASWPVSSPDGRNAITFGLSLDGALSYRVVRSGEEVLGSSPLGVRREDRSFTNGLSLVSAGEPRAVDERYVLPHGRRRERRHQARERTLAFRGRGGAQLELVARAADDGVAFRFRFPESDRARKTVIAETTGFRVPAGSTAWLLPHHDPFQYGPAYEDLFVEMAAGTRAPRAAGWSFPALFRAGRHWALVTEAAVDGSYCGSRLAAEAPGGLYRLRFPDPGEGDGVGAVNPVSSLPWTLPWRVVLLGDGPGTFLESTLVADLNPPAAVRDTSWIKPGRAAWSWWSESDSPRSAERLNAFTDLAAEMGWEYALVDANWNEMRSGTIDEVRAHAREKGVGLLFWYNSGGPHNKVTEQPRDRMHERSRRRAEFARLRDWGVRGIKVDFWHSDKPDMMRYYRELLEDSAEFHLLTNFHGCTLPRGWERTYPHLVTMEAVSGAEQYKFAEAYPRKAAWHNTVLPFTRNAVGAMDYTPVTFSDAKYPHSTTSAHELALAVVFESGVLHLADGVEAYRALPPEPKEFLKQVPAAWDETRALVAEPGRRVVVARRNEGVWYVGGISGQDGPATVAVDLSFLGPGAWTMRLIQDGDGDRSFKSVSRAVTARERLEVALRGQGGFVMRLAPEVAGK